MSQQQGFVFEGSPGGTPIENINLDAGTTPITGTSITLTGAVVAAGTHPLRTFGTGPSTGAIQAQLTQAIASTDVTKVGVAAFDAAYFVVDVNGLVGLVPTGVGKAYTNVTFAMSPYTVLSTDQYISCDTSGGAITLNFPNAPTFKQEWVVKDRTGNANTNPITITTPGGVVNFDLNPTLTMNTSLASISLKANNTPAYEIY